MMLVRPGSVNELAVRVHDENIVRDRMPRRRLARTDIVAQLLPRIACPLAGIWGAQDALYRGRIDRIGGVLRQAPRFRSLALLPDAGHWVQFESAETFNPLLIDTLRDGGLSQAASAPASSSAPEPKA